MWGYPDSSDGQPENSEAAMESSAEGVTLEVHKLHHLFVGGSRRLAVQETDHTRSMVMFAVIPAIDLGKYGRVTTGRCSVGPWSPILIPLGICHYPHLRSFE